MEKTELRIFVEHALKYYCKLMAVNFTTGSLILGGWGDVV